MGIGEERIIGRVVCVCLRMCRRAPGGADVSWEAPALVG